MKLTDIKGMTVNKYRCSTCPFNEHGDRHTRHAVEERCMTIGSQLCHGTDDKTLCRGARDHQLQIFHRLGLITSPTDAAWTAAQKRLCPQTLPSRRVEAMV